MRPDNWSCSLYPRRGPNRRELIKPNGLLLSAVAKPRIDVMYRFLIKTYPRAATSLRLSRLLAPRQFDNSRYETPRFHPYEWKTAFDIRFLKGRGYARIIGSKKNVQQVYFWQCGISPSSSLRSPWMFFQQHFIMTYFIIFNMHYNIFTNK